MDLVISFLFCFLFVLFFFFNDTATTEIYTLSLHDALPIFSRTCIFGQVNPFLMLHFDYLCFRRVLVLGMGSSAVGGAHAQISARRLRGSLGSSDRKSTRLNSSHPSRSRMPSSA